MQHNAHTIQAEVEKALQVVLRESISLTGSSRTDTGVHARQNFFHFDSALALGEKQVYNLNAYLPPSISIKSIRPMKEDAHSRFDAIGRRYGYYLYAYKDPFLTDRAWYYPYPVHLGILNEAATALLGRHDFTTFSKRNTQVKTMICELFESRWQYEQGMLVYRVYGNRFLRGMVRGLVATMLQAGREKITVDDLVQIREGRDCTLADFSAPPHGLFLEQVVFPDGYFG